MLKKHAEALKNKFGSALEQETDKNDIVVIPGLPGRAPKEVSRRNIAGIIQARMAEIIEHVHYEIKNSGLERELIGGIVVVTMSKGAHGADGGESLKETEHADRSRADPDGSAPGRRGTSDLNTLNERLL